MDLIELAKDHMAMWKEGHKAGFEEGRRLGKKELMKKILDSLDKIIEEK